MAYGKKSADWDFNQTQKKLDKAGDVKVAHTWSPERKHRVLRRKHMVARKKLLS